MKLTLDNVQKAGGFSGGAVARQIECEIDGNTYTYDVYVRRLSYLEAMGVDADLDPGLVLAHRIASSIVDEDGQPVFRVADITGYEDDGAPVLDSEGKPRGGLFSEMIAALASVVAEVNGLGKSTSSPS